jgi:hypothetical protein
MILPGSVNFVKGCRTRCHASDNLGSSRVFESQLSVARRITLRATPDWKISRAHF